MNHILIKASQRKSTNVIAGFFALFFSLCFVQSATAQTEQIEINLNWSGNSITASLFGQDIEIPALPFEWDQFGNPIHIFKKYEKNWNKFDVKLSIVSLETTAAASFDVNFMETNGLVFHETLTYTFRTSSDRGKDYLGIELIPYIKENGQLKRVKRVVFSATFSPRVQVAAPLKFITN